MDGTRGLSEGLADPQGVVLLQRLSRCAGK